MATITIEPSGRGFGKKRLMDAMKQELESGMLTYEDAEPVQIHMSQPEIWPVPRPGVIGYIKDRIFGVETKPLPTMTLDKEQRERMRRQLEAFKKEMDAVAACGVTAEDIKEAGKRITVLARGHHIRNADGTVTDVTGDPRYKCDDLNKETSEL